MKLTIFAGDFPYPARMGGVVDVWNRICAFRGLGCSIQLICWQSAKLADRPTADSINFVKSHVDELHIFTYKRGILPFSFKLMKILFLPMGASARLETIEGFSELKSAFKRFNPEAIWLDNILIAPLVKKIVGSDKKNYFIRSHNREHKYQLQLAKTGKGIKSFRSWINLIGLKRFELKTLKGATIFYDISQDDLNFWKKNGLKNGRWLPTLMEQNRRTELPRFDISYIGSLSSSINVAGIKWFVENVLPHLRLQKPNITCLISGSNPAVEFEKFLKSTPNINLMVNVEDPADVWCAGRVLINPVLSGSGINVKSVEMLFFDRPLVTTHVGVRGLPEIVKLEYCVADNEKAFATAILDALIGATVPLKSREQARSFFDIERMADVMSEMKMLTDVR